MSHNFGKTLLTVFTSVAALLLSSHLAFAADAIPVGGESYIKVIFAVGAMIGAGLAIGLALEIMAGHPQITYYGFLALAVFGITEAIYAFNIPRWAGPEQSARVKSLKKKAREVYAKYMRTTG